MEPSPFQDLAYILKNELPSLKGNLSDNILNLAKVADFCEDNYLNSSHHDKSRVYEETKNYAIQAVNSCFFLLIFKLIYVFFLVS
jgi:hypothetical protein